MSVCECAGCGRIFTGLRGFDMHQRLCDGRSICLDPATLTRRDGRPLYKPQDGRWSVRIEDKERPPNWRENRRPATSEA